MTAAEAPTPTAPDAGASRVPAARPRAAGRLDADWRRTLYRLRRNKLSLVGIAMVGLMAIIAVFGELIAPYPQDAGKTVHFSATLRGPSAEHWMGTDEVGRDVFSRVLIGTRISILTGLVVVGIGMVVGTALGLVAGYFGQTTNTIIMRVADVFLAIPAIALALAITTALRPSLLNSMLAISIVWWPWFARLVQAEVQSIKQEGFVEAGRSYGAGAIHIMLRDILPNALPLVVVKATLDIGFAILLGAALGFLGVGAQPPTPEWGSMIAAGRQFLPASWWLSTFPGIAILLAVVGFNLLGDGLRDVLDVKYDA